MKVNPTPASNAFFSSTSSPSCAYHHVVEHASNSPCCCCWDATTVVPELWSAATVTPEHTIELDQEETGSTTDGRDDAMNHSCDNGDEYYESVDKDCWVWNPPAISLKSLHEQRQNHTGAAAAAASDSDHCNDSAWHMHQQHAFIYFPNISNFELGEQAGEAVFNRALAGGI